MAQGALPPPGRSPDFDHRLSDPMWAEPLYLMMAAIVGLHAGVPQALALTRTDLAFDLARRELQRIEQYVPPGDRRVAPLLLRLSACATLAGGLTQEQCIAAARSEGEVLGLAHPGGPGVVAGPAADAVPGAEGGVRRSCRIFSARRLVLLALERFAPSQRDQVVVRAARSFGAAVRAR